MDEPGEDDIYILKHEKADSAHRRDADIPISVYTGDESVASHFALVTAYEDIKKRLKETEKENSVLKKRVRVLEEKVKKYCTYFLVMVRLICPWYFEWIMKWMSHVGMQLILNSLDKNTIS